MSKTVLAVDMGSATISAAVAGGELDQPCVLRRNSDIDDWPTCVYVGDTGTLLTGDDRATQASTVISHVDRLLGREALIVAGAPRHGDTLIGAALTPILRTAVSVLNAEVDVVAATYPSTWPPHIVDAYRHAVTRVSPAETMMVPWSQAIAAQTEPPSPFVECPITSLDFGARSASVTMVKADEHGNSTVLYSITHPIGGFVGAARPLINEIAAARGVAIADLGDNQPWWDSAVTALADARSNPEPGGETMIVNLPDPLGPMELAYDEVSALLLDHYEGMPVDPPAGGVVRALIDRSPVQQRWTLPGNPYAARPIVELTGGFANDPAVQKAVRDVTGSTPRAVDMPGQAAAWGAAKYAHQRANRGALSGGK